MSASSALMSTARAQKALIVWTRQLLHDDQSDGLQLAELAKLHAEVFDKITEFCASKELVSEHEVKVARETAGYKLT